MRGNKEVKRYSIEQTQRELEKKWTQVLQTAQEIKDQIEHEDILSKELQSFQDQLESTQSWIRKLKGTLHSIDKASRAEEIITHAQVQKVFHIFILYSAFCLKLIYICIYRSVQN